MHRVKKLTALILALLLCLGNVFLYVGEVRAEDFPAEEVTEEALTEEETAALIKAMAGENGDLLLFAADKNKVVRDVLGALRLELARQMDLLD